MSWEVVELVHLLFLAVRAYVVFVGNEKEQNDRLV